MAQPDRQYNDEQISVVEDLDPEPERGRGPGWRPDLWLGIPLLLAVVLFAGWQWWRQEYLSDQYHAGQDAVARHDWDAALGYFSTAAGYSNADALAASAQEMITERDHLYEAAVGYAGKGEWLPALRDLRAIDGIQPAFRDVEVREGKAQQEVYDDALGGAIVMREGVEPAGLYYRGEAGWLWLRGSDPNSSLLAQHAQGYLIYDVPAEGWQEPLPGTNNYYDDTSAFKGRSVMQAYVAGNEVEYTQLPLDHSYFVPFIAGNAGIWAAHFAFPTNERYSSLIVRTPFYSHEVAFLPYSGTISATFKLPADAAMVAVDYDSNRYLWAEWTNAHAYGADLDTVVNLYIGSAGETTKELIYTHTGGGLQSAQLSPDGRFVVAHTFTVVEGEPLREEQTTVLIDLLDPRRTATLITLTVPWADGGIPSAMTSTFVGRGPLKGKLVLSLYLGRQSYIQLIDPARDPHTVNNLITNARIEGSGYKTWEIISQGQSGILIAGQEFPGTSMPGTSMITIIEVDAQGEHTTRSIEMSSRSAIVDAVVAGDLLLWTSYDYGRSPNSPPYRSVHSLPHDLSSRQRPNKLYESEPREAFGRVDASLRLGRSLLAYTSGNTLHARAYDSGIDLELESGVSIIFENVGNSYYIGWMR